MRFKAGRMNASLYASILAHIPTQVAWGAAKRGIRARPVKSAYPFQECHRCHRVGRQKRSTQQTFCCQVCVHTAHADVNAAENLAGRLFDHGVAAGADRQALKALLGRRHLELADCPPVDRSPTAETCGHVLLNYLQPRGASETAPTSARMRQATSELATGRQCSWSW